MINFGRLVDNYWEGSTKKPDMSLQHSRIATFSAKMLSARLFLFCEMTSFNQSQGLFLGLRYCGNWQSTPIRRVWLGHLPTWPKLFWPPWTSNYTPPEGVKNLYVWQSKSIPSQEVFGCLVRIRDSWHFEQNKFIQTLWRYQSNDLPFQGGPTSYKRGWNSSYKYRVFHASYPLVFGHGRKGPL